MNKKIIAILLILAIQTPVFARSYIDRQLKESKKNVKYNSIKKHTAKYYLPKTDPKLLAEIKDPKLIKLIDVKPVNEDIYKAKLAKDEAIYKSKILPAIYKNLKTINIQPDAVDFYKVYRISERIIRANNLDYMNWRIAIRKTPVDFNASTAAANYIQIHTALYDSLYTNDDALAFVIAHEMAHQIFGHMQRSLEITSKIGRIYTSDSLIGTIQVDRYRAQSRMMEFMADTEGAILITRAGFNMDNAMAALNFMNALPNVQTISDEHPIPKKRIESMLENRTTFLPEWVDEGKNNILESEVLKCKKSSDRVSIVINKSPNATKFYEPETMEQKIRRVAYTNYRNGNMKNAIKYFKKLANVTDDYIPHLYLSYANEFLYNQTKQDKYLKRAIKSIEEAQELAPKNEHVLEQINDLPSLL